MKFDRHDRQVGAPARLFFLPYRGRVYAIDRVDQTLHHAPYFSVWIHILLGFGFGILICLPVKTTQ